MKKIVSLLNIISASISTVQAQTSKRHSKDSVRVASTPEIKKDWSKIELKKRPSDHFVLQFGYDGWAGRPDSVRTTGFGRHFNFYVMMDKPFVSNPHYSLAYGAGIGSSNIYFDHVNVNLAGTGSTLPFTDASTSGNHFNKMKLTTIFAELPVEFRYYEHPENKTTGWKAALGVKLGILVKSYTKGKDLQNSNGNSLYGSTYIEKVSCSRFLDSYKAAVSARVGYGFISLHGDFNALGIVKSGAGPTLNCYSIGVSFGGL